MKSLSRYVSQSWCPGCSSSGSSVHRPSPSLRFLLEVPSCHCKVFTFQTAVTHKRRGVHFRGEFELIAYPEGFLGGSQLGVPEKGIEVLNGDSRAVLLGGLVVQRDRMPGSPQSGCLDLSFRSQLDLPTPRFHLGLRKSGILPNWRCPPWKALPLLPLPILAEPVQAIGSV